MNEENICPEKPVEIQNHELKDRMKTMEPPSHSFRWDEGVSWHQHPGSAPRVEGGEPPITLNFGEKKYRVEEIYTNIH